MKAILLVLCWLLTVAYTIAGLEITHPYPKNEIVLEGDSLAISCSARDSSGYPSKVIFTRRSANQYTYVEIPNTQRVYVTNTTRNDTNGLTRTAVLHITSVKPFDHSHISPYQCWAYPAGGLGTIAKHVFTIYVIPKRDLPRAIVTGTTNTTLGGAANLTCDVKYSGNQYTAPLESLAWVKNTKTIENGSTTIDPLIFTAVSARHGGVYTCMAVVKLQASKPVNISLGTVTLTIRAQFVEATTEVVGTEGGSVAMECPAEGYPLNITWLRKLKNETQVPLQDAINMTMTERHVVTRPCSYCRFQLTISNIQSHDAGWYVCKANQGGQHHFDLVITSDRHSTTGRSAATTAISTKKETSATADTIEPTAGCLQSAVSSQTFVGVVLFGLLFMA